MDHKCSQRRTHRDFARNEEAGLRCVYHGWKFDADGNCIDMPNEPAESDFRTKVKAGWNPAREPGGRTRKTTCARRSSRATGCRSWKAILTPVTSRFCTTAG